MAAILLRRVLLQALVFLGLALSALPVQAMPIPPCPLRALCEESDAIVIGKVGKKEHVESEKRDAAMKAFEDTVVHLNVTSVLKGDVKAKTVRVYNSFGMVCPSPAWYEEGATVLAFLEDAGKESTYRTYALSYGAKTLSGRALELYSKRVTEYMAIRKLRKKADRLDRTAEWTVKLVEDPLTVWEGAEDLQVFARPLTDEWRRNLGGHLEEAERSLLKDAVWGEVRLWANSNWELDENGWEKALYLRGLRDALTADRKKRLVDALLKSKRMRWGELLLTKVVLQWDRGRVMPFLLKYLETVKDDPAAHAEDYVIGTMEIVAGTRQTREEKALIGQYGKIPHVFKGKEGRVNVKKMSDVLAAFIKLQSIAGAGKR
jgi:hypothetical protein